MVLLLLSLRFSVDLSRADEDRRRLTEEAAILRLRLSAWNVASKFSRGVRPRRASLVPLRRRRPLTIRPAPQGKKRKKKR